MSFATPMKNVKRLSDSSSDMLRTGGPSMLGLIARGARRASPGALYVLGVCLVISFVAILARL